jgi:hypothetical protein
MMGLAQEPTGHVTVLQWCGALRPWLCANGFQCTCPKTACQAHLTKSRRCLTVSGMNTEDLTARLRHAHSRHSLRTLAKWCEVSHETLRSIILKGVADTLSLARYNKIDNGLKNNGF